jgi:hypothetical protein
MCGIIGYISKQKKSDAGRKIIEQYQDQHQRGTQGFGLISVHKDHIDIERSTEPVKALLDARFSDAPVMMFHHRAPTSTDNKIRQTHPIVVSHDELKHDYYVIHNGVISNDDDLFKIHTEELGYVYTTLEKATYESPSRYGYAASSYHYNKFNDSESFAIELARYLEGRSEEIGTLGSVAFIALRVNKKTGTAIDMIWGCNDRNPVEFLETETGILIASTIYDKDALGINDNMFEQISLKKLFKMKTMPSDLGRLVTQGDLKFKEVPKPTVSTSPYYPRTAGTVIQPELPASKKELGETSKLANDDEDDYLPTDGMSKRDTAFTRMADRIIEDISIEIEDLCYKMSERSISEDEINTLGSMVVDTLIEKNEIANTKMRPYFDKIEEEDEIVTQVDIDSGYDDKKLVKLDEELERQAEHFYNIS